MLGNFTYCNPTKLYFGEDSLDNLNTELPKYGNNIVLIYGGGSVKKNGIYNAVIEILEKHEKLLPQFLSDKHKLYDNKTLMAKLGVREKYLKKLRDNGYLGYSREGDKYWYTQEDVDRFLRRFHYDAFAIGDELPKQEGGGYV